MVRRNEGNVARPLAYLAHYVQSIAQLQQLVSLHMALDGIFNADQLQYDPRNS